MLKDKMATRKAKSHTENLLNTIFRKTAIGYFRQKGDYCFSFGLKYV